MRFLGLLTEAIHLAEDSIHVLDKAFGHPRESRVSARSNPAPKAREKGRFRLNIFLICARRLRAQVK